jgi:tetratricopeptide (TPR) repeat protein
MMVWPTNLLCNYSINTIPFATWSNGWVLLSLGAYLSLIALAIYRLTKNLKDYWALSIVYFLCSIALFSNIPFLIGAIFAERFAFFASVGICIALPVTIEYLVLKINKGKMPAMDRIMSWQALFPVLAIFIGMTVTRNPDWADNYTLYKNDAEKAQVNSWLWYDLGNELVTSIFEQSTSPAAQQRALLESIPALNKSVAIYPDYAKSHSDLSNAYIRLKKLDSAEYHARLAIKFDPRDQVAVNNLAAVYFNTARFSDALELCKKTVAMKPDFVNGYYNIGVCFFNIHEPDSALVYFKKTYAMAPDCKDAIVSIASTYKALDKPDSFAKYDALAHQKR